MKLFLKIIIPVAILLAAYGIFKWLGTLRPPVMSQKAEKAIAEVQVIQISPQEHQPSVKSFGTVQPYFETVLAPQVSGRIDEVSAAFRVGKQVKKGTVLAKIDATDYQAALAQEQANLATARRTLAEEIIRAKQAEEDWKASGRRLRDASDFVLRKPQLSAARAVILSSEIAVEKALADIERTQIRAPYDAVITERSASEGNLANSQSALGRLVSTEFAEVRLPLTAEQRSRLTLPTMGQVTAEPLRVTLTTRGMPDVIWSANLVRTEPTVDPKNQVTFAIAEIAEPYGSGKLPLPVGTFVNASISGKVIAQTLRIPESALVNDAFVWSVDTDNKLVMLQADRVYSLEDEAYIRLQSKDVETPVSVVVRPLTNFRIGMEVKPAIQVQ